VCTVQPWQTTALMICKKELSNKTQTSDYDVISWQLFPFLAIFFNVNWYCMATKILSIKKKGMTGYGLDGLRIESWWGRDFPHLSIPAPGPNQPPVQWVQGLSRGVKSGRGVTLIPHHLPVPWSWKGRDIPLLPLWAVRPVQSLSACTRVHFTFTNRYQ
jgi:hypothetical protein